MNFKGNNILRLIFTAVVLALSSLVMSGKVVAPAQPAAVVVEGRLLVPGGPGNAPVRKPAEPDKDKPRPVPLINVDDEMSGYLDRAREMIESKDYAGAIEILQALLNRSEQCFVPADDDTRLFVSLASKSNEVIGQLPPDGLRLYRGLYDPRAKRMFGVAIEQFDELGLRDVIRRYFHTSYGDDALGMLGAILFDRGEFSQAARCWRKVVSACNDGQSKEPRADEAVLLAKIVAAHHFAGESERASQVMKILTERHPKTLASFGGRDEEVAVFAGRMLSLSPPAAGIRCQEGWPSLAGAPDSVAVMETCRPVLNPRWSTIDGRLEDNPNIKLKAAVTSVSRRGSRGAKPGKVMLREGRLVIVNRTGNRTSETVMPAMIHPIVVGKSVIFRAADGIVSHDLLTGEKQWETIEFPLYQSKAPSGVRRYNTPFPMAVEDRGLWTVTAGEGKVFATGKFVLYRSPYHSRVMWMRMGKHSVDTSVLSAFSIADQGRLVWQLGDGAGDSDLLRGGKFLTAPTYIAGRVYALVEYIQAHHLVCLDAENGRLIWEAMVGQAPIRNTRYGRNAHLWQDRTSPPAVSDGRVFVVTNAGVIGAFEADTGRSLWAYQYESKPNLSAPPNPIVVTKGKAICLPADCDTVLALRTDTGRLDWSADRQGQRHLTAVDRSRLLLSSKSVVIISVADGKQIWTADRVSGVHGRPAVTRNAILASGRGEMIRISLPDFAVTRPPLAEPNAILGNLVCVDGKLLAANAAGVSAYFPFETARAELTQRIEKAPAKDIPLLLYQRGMNAFNAGRPSQALGDLLKVREGAADNGDSALLAKTDQALYRTYVSLADKASDNAVRLELYNKAQTYAYSDRSRGEMLVRLTKHYGKNGLPDRAAELAQKITVSYAKIDLADVEIGEAANPFVRDTIDTKRWSGYELGHRLIKSLIAEHGQDCYAAFDARAESDLTSAVAANRPEAMVRVTDTYRHSAHSPMALLRAAESRYRRALRLTGLDRRKPLSLAGGDLIRIERDYPSSGLTPSAKVGLAMVYQQMNPRVTWLAIRGLEDVPADARISFADVSGSAGEVKKRFASQLRPVRPSPLVLPGPIKPPLERIFAGSQNQAEAQMILRHADGRPIRCGKSLFLLYGSRICRFDPSKTSFDKAIEWKTTSLLDSARLYRWYNPHSFQAGLSSDSSTLVVGSRGGFTGVDVRTGKVRWRYTAGKMLLRRLFALTIADDRIAVLTYDGGIYVMDMRSGKELWNHKVNRKEIPWLSVPQIAGGVLLTRHGRSGRKASVFDINTGKLLGETPLGKRSIQAYLTPDGLVVACDGRMLRLIEPILGANKPIWEFDFTAKLSPSILGVTRTHVFVSPISGSGLVEMRSLAGYGRISRTFQTQPIDGKTAVPVMTRLAGNRLYVVACSQTHSSRVALSVGRACYFGGPSLHAFDLITGEACWPVDLVPPGASRRHRYSVIPFQIGRGHVGVLVSNSSYNHNPAAMVIDASTGKVVQRFSLPNAMPINRLHRAFRHRMISSPVITAGRLVLETHKGLEVYGQKQ